MYFDNSRFIHWTQLAITHHILNWLTRWRNMVFPSICFCVTDQQLHTLIRLEVSPPSFDTSARMKYLCGPQLNQIIDKDFGWGEIWTRISQTRSRRSNHYSTSFHNTLCEIYGRFFIGLAPTPFVFLLQSTVVSLVGFAKKARPFYQREKTKIISLRPLSNFVSLV